MSLFPQKKTDRESLLRAKRNKDKAARIMAINAGIYVKRKYTKPLIKEGRDGISYVKLKLSESFKSDNKIDEMLVANNGMTYEIQLISNGEVVENIVFTEREAELYAKAISAIKRSGL